MKKVALSALLLAGMVMLQSEAAPKVPAESAIRIVNQTQDNLVVAHEGCCKNGKAEIIGPGDRFEYTGLRDPDLSQIFHLLAVPEEATAPAGPPPAPMGEPAAAAVRTGEAVVEPLERQTVGIPEASESAGGEVVQPPPVARVMLTAERRLLPVVCVLGNIKAGQTVTITKVDRTVAGTGTNACTFDVRD